MNARTHRRAAVAALAAAALALVAAGGCTESGDDFSVARAYRITNRAQLIGGDKALGAIGDIMLENDRVRVIINAHPTSLAASRRGGAIIDADIKRFEQHFDPSKAGNDQLGEITPAIDIKGFGIETIPGSGPLLKVPQDAVAIVDNGGGGDAAVVRVSGELFDFLQPLAIIPVPLNGLPLRAETTYSLAPGDTHVDIETTFLVLNEDGGEPERIFDVAVRPLEPNEDPITAMIDSVALGDAMFFGNSLDMFGPGVFGFAPDFQIEESYLRGESILASPLLVDWVAGIGDGIGYAMVGDEGPISLPLMESILTIGFSAIAQTNDSTPEPGARYRFKRKFVISDEDVAGLLDEVVRIKGWPAARVSGHVFFEGASEPASGVQVHVFKHPRFTDSGEYVRLYYDYDKMNESLAALDAGAVTAHRLLPLSRFTTDAGRFDAAKDGSFSGLLPVDEATGRERYILLATGPGFTRSKLYPIEVKAGGNKEAALILEASGAVNFRVVGLDAQERPTPAKVTAIRLSDGGTPDPFIGEGFFPANEVAVVHTLDGTGEITLSPGEYRLVASRGPEYSIDEATVTLKPLQTETAILYIERVVDTSGWIAGDFHLHTMHSVDAGASISGRLKSAMVEGVEVIASSDHDYITNYAPELEQLGGRDLLYTLAGDELSHLSYGHFNGYPLRYGEGEIAGGAPDWKQPSPSAELPDGGPMPEWTPQDVFDGLRARGDRGLINQDPIVIVNHSQESITGYLRAYGFLQYRGVFSTPDIFTLGNPVIHGGALFSTDASESFSWDFDGMELINGKRYQDIRTATDEDRRHSELFQPRPADSPYLPVLVRTGEEQARIETGDLILDMTNRGMIDDYFTILAQGKRLAGLGCSDSHDLKNIETGKARTYVMMDNDDPRFVNVNELITNMKHARAMVTTGPFVEAWVDGHPIGDEFTAAGDVVGVRIRAQAPPWMALDRIEIYGNGRLIGEIGRDASGIALGCDTEGFAIAGRGKVDRFNASVPCALDADTFINVVAIGYESMTPVVNPIEGPSIELTDTLLLGISQLLQRWTGLDIGNPLPQSGIFARNFDYMPYGITNAIYIDLDGTDSDGDGYLYDGPGFVPGYFDEDDAPRHKAPALPSDAARQATVDALRSDPNAGAAMLAARIRARSFTSGLFLPKDAPGDAIDVEDAKNDEGGDFERMTCGG
ncbi:hypothetical protein K8I61_06330 [bacterium]|nr:hypothetical protein [bacterium]